MDPRTGAVQTGSLRSDSDAGQHDVHSDGDECGPLPGDLSPAAAHLQTEGDDWRIMARRASLRHASTLHLQTGLTFVFVIISDFRLYRPTREHQWLSSLVDLGRSKFEPLTQRGGGTH